jgi:energy-coupling factor transporter ATP-binding protein EcfA2
MLELGIGFAPDLTVRQNIQIQGRLAGIPGKHIVAAEDRILSLAGLLDFRETPLRLCPSGSAVQLGFATMIGLGAEIVLADEVLAVGDAAFRKMCEEQVEAVGASGVSVLFVSHDMAAIRRICSRRSGLTVGALCKLDRPTRSSAPTRRIAIGPFAAATDRRESGRKLPSARVAASRRRSCAGWRVDHHRRWLSRRLIRVSRPDVTAWLDVELWHDEHHLFTGHEPADAGAAGGDLPHRRACPGRLPQRAAISGAVPAASRSATATRQTRRPLPVKNVSISA